MDKFIINGGNALKGKVHISGAKNAVLPLMAASLLTQGETHLKNTPHLKDIKTMSDVLRVAGGKVSGKEHELRIDTRAVDHLEAPYELVKTMRASIYVLGPMLARYGRVRCSLPGGCAWGPRPVDLHIKGIQALGAQVDLVHGYIEARAKRLTANKFTFNTVSVGATANILMAAVLAKGESRLENCAVEPEILNLVEFLKAMGAIITLDKNCFLIQGVSELKAQSMEVIPDRIEAGTYIAAVATTGGDILMGPVQLDHIQNSIGVFESLGISTKMEGKNLRIISKGPDSLRSGEFYTGPFPGFPTDMQAQLMSTLCLVRGRSTITDTIYHDRFTHISELQRLGADIALRGNTAIINGIKQFSGAKVMATDLRASAALVIAGLAARGSTELLRVYHIDRGYEKIEEKLRGLGADISRIRDPQANY